MPDPTPLPVQVVGLSDALWEYGDKAEEMARLALAFGALAAFCCVVLLTALVVVAGLRR